MSCLDDNVAAAFVQGLLPTEQVEQIDGHFETCSACRSLMLEFARLFAEPSGDEAVDRSGPSPPGGARLREGDRLERYIIIGLVGAGAMGSVYSAYDPELERRVALKVLRTEAGNELQSDLRLLREARTLAALSHPNVVPVYDACVQQGQLFVAMELVPGSTLRQHMQRRDRPFDLVALVRQAGAGLAAAHRAGIVHRDFKPENVLIRDDGRALVADFGLATDTHETGPPQDTAETTSDEGTPGRASLGLTRAGAVIGTPVYMAPEQMAGSPASFKSDQYAFCAVMVEALLGRPPFSGGGFDALLARKQQDRLEVARPAGVDARAWHAIRRGLQPDPHARWPTMDDLLQRLDTKRRNVGGVAAVFTLAGVTSIGALAGAPLEQQGECDLPTSAWNDGAAKETLDALERVHGIVAPERVTRRLAAWADEWVQARSAACTGAAERGSVPGPLLRCLERRRAEMNALLELLPTAERPTRARTLEAVETLDRLEACTSEAVEALGTQRPSEPAAERTGRAEIARARAHRAAGDYEAAKQIAASAAQEAQAPGARVAWVEATIEQGLASAALGGFAEAERSLREAASAATAESADALAASAWLGLLGTLAAQDGRHADAMRVGRFARAALERIAESPELEVQWRIAMAKAALGAGDASSAREHIEAARTLEERGAPSLRLAELMGLLARVELRDGDPAASLRLMEESVAMHRDILGPDHPRVGDAWHNYANVLHSAGRYEDAVGYFARAAEILEASVGPLHPHVASSLAGLGLAQARLERRSEARDHLQRALQIRQEVLGPNHPDVAVTLMGLANLDYAESRYDRARAGLERALAILTEHHDATHPRVIGAMLNLANVRYDQGDLDAAEQTYRHVIEVRAEALGPDHPDVATATANLAQVMADKGELEQARQMLQRARAIATQSLGSTHPFTLHVERSLSELPSSQKGANEP